MRDGEFGSQPFQNEERIHRFALTGADQDFVRCSPLLVKPILDPLQTPLAPKSVALLNQAQGGKAIMLGMPVAMFKKALHFRKIYFVHDIIQIGATLTWRPGLTACAFYLF